MHTHFADHPLVSQRYFFPRVTPLQNETRVHVENATLGCVHVKGGHALTLLHFHGNGEVVADYVPNFPGMMDGMSVNTFLSEYRGYGSSTGTPLLSTMLDDLPAIQKAVGPPESLIVFGRSIGSIYAIDFAHRYPQIAGLVLESGIADVLERILLRVSPRELGASFEEIQQAFLERFDHEEKLRQYKGPSLLLHAKGDHLVDVSHAQRNASWAQGPTKLVVLPNGDHNSIFHTNKEQYLQELTEFVTSCQ